VELSSLSDKILHLVYLYTSVSEFACV